jgi:crotonobetainyl-CoA:carnitine CoA-transferase CaiB-like acyl-CoA transferase
MAANASAASGMHGAQAGTTATGGVFQPFAGLKVIDLTRVLAGPYCSYLLGLLGAEVIKVEPPGRGETIRRRPGGDPAFSEAGVSVAWATQSANKRCITLDLDQPRGQEIFRQLAAGADVVVQNLRTGAAERRGIGYEQVSAINPKVIYCSITAYGRTGPRAQHPAYDSVIQAVSGLMSLTGMPDGDPLKVGPPVIDYVSGMNAALAVVCALFERVSTGRGRHIDLSMLDSNFALMTSALTLFVNTGREPTRPGNDAASRAPASTTYRVSDGQFAIAINEEHQYVHLFQSMGLAHLLDDERFATSAARNRNIPALRAQLQRVFETNTSAHWERVLNEAGAPGGRVNTLAEVTAHAQFASRNLFQPVEVTAGAASAQMQLPLAPFSVDGERGSIRLAPRPVGADTDEVLHELGMDAAQIDLLRANATI